MLDNHVYGPYPNSISHIPYRYSHRYLIDVRSPISISHIDIGSYLVTLADIARPVRHDIRRPLFLESNVIT